MAGSEQTSNHKFTRINTTMKPIIEKILAAYDAVVARFTIPQDILLLLVRAAWGFAFFQAGWGKFGRLEGVAEFFGSMGIPAPEFHAVLVASVETGGGILLLLGLFSRLTALPLAVTMIVATFTAHLEEFGKLFTEDFTDFLEAAPTPYLVASLIILFFGPGRISLDALLRKLCPCRKASEPEPAR